MRRAKLLKILRLIFLLVSATCIFIGLSKVRVPTYWITALVSAALVFPISLRIYCLEKKF